MTPLQQAQQYFGLGLTPQGSATGTNQLEDIARKKRRQEEMEYQQRLARDEVGVQQFDPFLGLNTGDDPSPGLMSYFAPADAVPVVGAGVAAAKGAGGLFDYILNRGISAMENKVDGFYSGNPIAQGVGVVKSLPYQAAKNVGKTLVDPRAAALYNEQGVSRTTQKILERNLAKIDEARATPWLDLNTTAGQKIRDDAHVSGKTIYGQLTSQAYLNRQGRAAGTPQSDLYEEWLDKNFFGVGDTLDEYVELSKLYTAKSGEASDEVRQKGLDLLQGVWGLPDDTIVAVKKWKKGLAAGSHDRDIISSSQENYIKNLLIANGDDFRTLDELRYTLETGAEKGGYKVLETTGDGVYVTFSPQGKSGYTEGGFNAVVLVRPDRKTTFFASDDHDMFGMLPSGYKRLATVYPPYTIDPLKSLRKSPPHKRRGIIEGARDRLKNPPKPKSSTSGSQEKKGFTSNLTKDQEELARKIMNYRPTTRSVAESAIRRAAPLAGAGSGLIYMLKEEDD